MKKSIYILFISMFLILPFKVSAVELEKSFDKNFDISLDSNLTAIYSYDNDGNFNGYLLYDKYSDSYYKNRSMVMVSPENKIIWSKVDDEVTNFSVSSVYYNHSLIIKRINPDTNDVIWEKTLENVSYSPQYEINSHDSNGNLDGLIVFFYPNSFETYTPSTYMIKYDMDGNVLWTKKVSDAFLTNDNGEIIRVYTNGPTHGMYEVLFYNLNTNTGMFPINLVSSGLPLYLFFSDSNELISLYTPYNTGTRRLVKINANQERLLEKEFDYNYRIYSIVNGRNYDGTSDGTVIIASSDGVIKMDSDFNVISKFDVDYTVNKIIESRDSNGEFNGYLMIGSNNGKLYLTNFTYPKRVIESKSNDVEVISEAYPGKVITLAPKEKEGYYVKRIIVRDSSGKEIEVSSDNTFVMPDDDVSIEVVYEKRETIVNPDTASTISIVLVIVSVIIFGTVLIRVTVLDKSI